MHSAFARFKDPKSSLLPQMILFVMLHLATMSIALYKANTLGLLPTADDWGIDIPIQHVDTFLLIPFKKVLIN